MRWGSYGFPTFYQEDIRLQSAMKCFLCEIIVEFAGFFLLFLIIVIQLSGFHIKIRQNRESR